MNRYMLFAGGDYYPAGGWKDFQGDFDTYAAAKEALGKWLDDPKNHEGVSGVWWHIVGDGEIIESGEG